MNASVDTPRIPLILERQPCPDHKAPVGIPCYHVRNSAGGYFAAVCNKRAKRAGFFGRISQSALSRRHSKLF